MTSRLGKSWIYRSGSLYRWLASVRPIPASDGGEVGFRYLTLGGAAHLDMMEASLRSLSYAWGRSPRVRIVIADDSDSGLVRKRFQFWPGEIEVVSWRACAAWAESDLASSLARFAEREPMGRKMAAMFQAWSEGAVLYADVDLLWFRSSPFIEGWADRDVSGFAMSSDIQAAYDPHVVETWFPALREPPFYCAGVLLGTGTIPDLEPVIDALEYAAKQGVGVTEQTIFAGLAHSMGRSRIPDEDVHLSIEDRFASRPTFLGKRWAARHYVGQVRHLFWRDAWALGRFARKEIRA